MAPDKDRKPSKKAPREEFGVAYYTKELGRPLQRKLLQRRLSDFSDNNNITAASHGDEPSWEGYGPPPPEDRAG